MGDRLAFVQSIIAMERWRGYPQYENDKGLGRVALVASILSLILGMNCVLCLQLVLINIGLLPEDIFGEWSDERRQLTLQWTVYVIVLCTFHLGEFFTTSIFNPTVTSADSFMVRVWYCTEHILCVPEVWSYYSIMSLLHVTGKSFQGLHSSGIGKLRQCYCMFVIILATEQHLTQFAYERKLSCVEFCIRMVFFPSNNSPQIFRIGILVALAGQICRSWAMITCGESFNHYIQIDKKENHVLVTHGM